MTDYTCWGESELIERIHELENALEFAIGLAKAKDVEVELERTKNEHRKDACMDGYEKWITYILPTEDEGKVRELKNELYQKYTQVDVVTSTHDIRIICK